MDVDIRAITEEVKRHSAFVEAVEAQVGRVIVGQKYMVERLLIGLLCEGHVLLEGVPGLAKTLTVRTVARSVQARFSRIQFTPDLLPADVVGTMVLNPKTGDFSVRKGPVFANLVLADEINRAPAKVQSALLEAMQERQVTIGDESFRLPDPFLVLATQNPMEQEGTYPLPEAQVDRFMLKIKVGYPSRREEREILDRARVVDPQVVEAVLEPAQLTSARDVLRSLYFDEKLKDYVLDLVFATREPARFGLEALQDYIAFGASPRATLALSQAATAHAFLRHRGFVTPDDVKAVAMDVLRHRLTLTYEADAEQVTPERIVEQVLEKLTVP